MKKFIIYLCLLWMGFIFYMSSNNGEVSHNQSSKVVKLIENTQEKLQSEEDKVILKKSQTNKKVINEKEVKDNTLDYIVRKNAHGFMYMVLAFLVSSTFFVYNKKGNNAIVYILFICLLYAVTDEFHQSFVPGRTSLASDILVDFAGASIGLGLFYIFYYKIYKRHILKNQL